MAGAGRAESQAVTRLVLRILRNIATVATGREISAGRTLRPPYCDVPMKERVIVGPADEWPGRSVDHLLGDEIDHLQIAPVGITDIGDDETRRGREIGAVARTVDELGAAREIEHPIAALEHVQPVAAGVGDDDALRDIDVEGEPGTTISAAPGATLISRLMVSPRLRSPQAVLATTTASSVSAPASKTRTSTAPASLLPGG